MTIYKKTQLRLDKEAYDTLVNLAAKKTKETGRRISLNETIIMLIKQSKNKEIKRDDEKN